jgi:hypothetical protein
MKIAQIVFAITAITCVVTIFNLASSRGAAPIFFPGVSRHRLRHLDFFGPYVLPL